MTTADETNHWSQHPEFAEFLPLLDPRMTREQAEAFKAAVMAECEKQVDYMRDPAKFAGRLKKADAAAVQNAYRFLASAKTAAESSAHWMTLMMVPWFERELAAVMREAGRRRLVLARDDAPIDPYAMGMILHLSYGPQRRQRDYHAAGLPNPFTHHD